ncbi:30S ribosomal protein S17 [Guggenheimella bovis]
MERNQRRSIVGFVVSDKMDKTITVKVEKYVSHPLYSRKVKVSKKYHAHDEQNEAVIGDKVRLMETKPLSKNKRWRLVEIVEKVK